MPEQNRNIGMVDRVIRVLIGLALLGLPLAWYGLEYITNWGFIGILPLTTGLFGYCPFYKIIGVNTCAR